jgi:hypothetical protein
MFTSKSRMNNRLLSTRAARSSTLVPRRRYVAGGGGAVVTSVLLLVLVGVLCNDQQHQTEAFSTSSSSSSSSSSSLLLGTVIRPSNSRVLGNHNDSNSNSNSSPAHRCRSRTFLSVSSRPVVHVKNVDNDNVHNVDGMDAGEQLLKTTQTSTDTSTGTESSTSTDAAIAPITLDAERDRIAKEEFQKGFRIIGFITLLNASLAPIWCVPLYCTVLYCTVLYCCIALEYGSVYLQYGLKDVPTAQPLTHQVMLFCLLRVRSFAGTWPFKVPCRHRLSF